MKKAIIGLVTILVIFTSMFSVIVAKRKYIFTNQKFYTEQELKTEYNKGYDKGAEENRDEALYQKLKELTVSNIQYQKQVEDLTKQKEELETENSGLNSTIASLKNIKAENEATINSLQETITSNEKSISDLTIEKNKLQNKVNELNAEIETLKSSSDSEKETLQNLINSKTAQIESLNNQITTLQANISQIQETNRLNTNTITSLNTQIANLNTQISDMTLASQNSTSRINALTNKINQLQESITYYENFIAQLENEEKVVATFEYDGSVYNIQIVSKGSIVIVTAPIATEDKIFNGWKVDGELVDLSTYTINSNTKFVADITYKQKVVFKTDTETTYNTQYVIKGQYATLPTAPTKAGYEFDGWSINGVDIVENIETTAVNEDTTYIAVFTKLHSVTFLYETETKDSQQVRNGSYATNVTVEDTTYKIFNGWTVNGTLVDITTYKIVADTVFVADVTYKYDVKFMVDETEYNSQIVTAGSYPTLPTKPTKNGFYFVGWSIDGSNIIENVGTTAVNNNVTYIAIFNADYDKRSIILTYNNTEIGIAEVIGNFCYIKMKNGWILDSYKLRVKISDNSDVVLYASLPDYEESDDFIEIKNTIISSGGKVACAVGDSYFKCFRSVACGLDNTGNVVYKIYLKYTNLQLIESIVYGASQQYQHVYFYYVKNAEDLSVYESDRVLEKNNYGLLTTKSFIRKTLDTIGTIQTPVLEEIEGYTIKWYYFENFGDFPENISFDDMIEIGLASEIHNVSFSAKFRAGIYVVARYVKKWNLNWNNGLV